MGRRLRRRRQALRADSALAVAAALFAAATFVGVTNSTTCSARSSGAIGFVAAPIRGTRVPAAFGCGGGNPSLRRCGPEVLDVELPDVERIIDTNADATVVKATWLQGRLALFLDVGYDSLAMLRHNSQKVKRLASLLQAGDVLHGLTLRAGAEGRLSAEPDLDNLEVVVANRADVVPRVEHMAKLELASGTVVKKRGEKRLRVYVDVGYHMPAMLQHGSTEFKALSDKLNLGDVLEGLVLFVDDESKLIAKPNIHRLTHFVATKTKFEEDPPVDGESPLRNVAAEADGRPSRHVQKQMGTRKLPANGTTTKGKLIDIRYMKGSRSYYFDVGYIRGALFRESSRTVKKLMRALRIGDVVSDLRLEVDERERISATTDPESLRLAIASHRPEAHVRNGVKAVGTVIGKEGEKQQHVIVDVGDNVSALLHHRSTKFGLLAAKLGVGDVLENLTLFVDAQKQVIAKPVVGILRRVVAHKETPMAAAVEDPPLQPKLVSTPSRSNLPKDGTIASGKLVTVRSIKGVLTYYFNVGYKRDAMLRCRHHLVKRMARALEIGDVLQNLTLYVDAQKRISAEPDLDVLRATISGRLCKGLRWAVYLKNGTRADGTVVSLKRRHAMDAPVLFIDVGFDSDAMLAWSSRRYKSLISTLRVGDELTGLALYIDAEKRLIARATNATTSRTRKSS